MRHGRILYAAICSAFVVSLLSLGTPALAQLTLEIPEEEFGAVEDYKPIPVPDPSGGPVNQLFESMELDMTGTLPEAVLDEMLGGAPYDFVDVVWGMEVTGDWTNQMTGKGTLQITDFTEGRGASLSVDPERFTGQEGFRMFNARLQTDGDHVFTLSAAFPPESGGEALGTKLDEAKSLFEVTWLCHMFEPWRTGCVDFPDEYYETELPVLNRLHIQRGSGGYKIDFAARVRESRTHRDRGYRLTEPTGRLADVRGWVCDRASWEENPETCVGSLEVTSNSPPDRRENVHLKTPQIKVKFNFPVDADVLDDNFSLTTRDNQDEPLKVPGEVVALSDTNFRFTPDNALESGVIYEAHIEGGEDGVRGRAGEVLKSDDHAWRFTTLVDLENHGKPVEEPVRNHVFQTVRDAPLVVDKPALQRIYVEWQPHDHIHKSWQPETFPAKLEINVLDQSEWRIDPQAGGSVEGDVVRVVRSDLPEQKDARREVERQARNTINVYGWTPDEQGGDTVVETLLTPNDPYPASLPAQEVMAEREVEHWNKEPAPLVFRYAFLTTGDWSEGIPEGDRRLALAALGRAEEFALQVFPVREVRSVFTGVATGRPDADLGAMLDLLGEMRDDNDLGVARDDVLILFVPWGQLTGSEGKPIAGYSQGRRFGGDPRRGLIVTLTESVGAETVPVSMQAQTIVHEVAHNHGLAHRPGDAPYVKERGLTPENFVDPSIEGFRIAPGGMSGWNKSHDEGNGQWSRGPTPLMWPGPLVAERMWINEREYKSLMNATSQ